MPASLRFVPILSLLILGALAAPCDASSRPYRIVVHPDNPTPGLTRAQLSEIFLGRRTTWRHGAPVTVVEPDHEASPRLAFLHDIHDQSPAALEAYWRRQMLTGRSLPPAAAANDMEVLDFVRSRVGAIGYVSADVPLAGVREIGIVEEARLVESRQPRYTSSARRFGVEGTVVLEVEVDADGTVRDIEPVRELAHGLTHEAVRAVRAWRYEPATLAGRPVPSTVQVAIHFTP